MKTPAGSRVLGTTRSAGKSWRTTSPPKAADDWPDTLILKAKDFAAENRIFNARQHQMGTELAVSKAHVTNHTAIRNTLLERGIRPESLSPAEDVKKVERRLLSEDKKALKKLDALDS